MDKPSPLTWQSRAKVDAWNYGYRRPLSAVRIRDEKDQYAHVESRCEPHVNCLDFPPRQKVEDYSWVHEAPDVSKNLPPEHPLSPQKMRERARAERAAELAAREAEEREANGGLLVSELDGIPYAEMRSTGGSQRDTRSQRSSTWGKDNPNTADFNSKSTKKKSVVMGKAESAFGDVEKFKGHRAGGHFSSKSKSLLEITRKDEIDIQKERDIAEAKARFIMSGGRLV